MDKQSKDVVLENLSAAALLGLLALIVASVAFILDNRVDRQEKADLARMSAGKVAGTAVPQSDPAFRHIYPLIRRDRHLYGSIASIGDGRGSARIAAIFAPDGKLDSVKLIGLVPADAPYAREGWFSDFLGKGGDDPFPLIKSDSRKPDAINGATESFMATSQVLARLSERVIAAAARAQEGRQ